MKLSRRLFLAESFVALGSASIALSACQPKDTPPPAEGEQAAPTKAPTAAPVAEDPGKVRFLERHSTAFGHVWERAIEAYNEKFPDVEVERIQPAGGTSHQEKLTAMVAGGDTPDVYWTTWDWIVFQRQGFFRNLTPTMEAEGFDPREKYEPQWIDMWKQEDGDYGLPWDAFIFMLNYHKDMFDAKGIAYPKDNEASTWAEVLEMGKGLTEWNDKIPVTLGTQAWRPYWGIWWIWMVQAGFQLYDAGMTKVNLEDPKLWEMFDFFGEWGWKHKVEPTSAIQTDLPLNFDSGTIGTSIMATCQWSGTRNLATWNWDVSPFPQWTNDGDPKVLGWTCPVVVLEDGPNPENAWEFLKEACGPKAYLAMYEEGMTLPTLREHTDPVVKTFLDAKPPDNNTMNIEWARYMVTDVPWNNGAWQTILGIINDALGQVYLGEMKAEQAMTEIAIPQCNKALKDLTEAGTI